MRNGKPPIVRALTRVFASEVFGPNPACVELLDLLVDRPEIGASSADRVTECLLEMVVYEPSRVGKTALAVFNACHSSQNNNASSTYLAGETFVTIARALQDQGGEAAELGAELFERILELRVPYADELLLDLDKRTTNSAQATRPSRLVGVRDEGANHSSVYCRELRGRAREKGLQLNRVHPGTLQRPAQQFRIEGNACHGRSIAQSSLMSRSRYANI